MEREWAASCHQTASSCFNWDGLHSESDIPYDKLDEAEREAEFPPPGFRLPDENGNLKRELPPRRLPPITPHKHFPRKHFHLYVRMRKDIGLYYDNEEPPPVRSMRFLKAGIPLEDNTPEDLVDRKHVKKQRAILFKRSKGQVQFTNRPYDL